ncbi:MAG: efflux RND transporter permease subunit [Schleiferiaceae bacterium]|nr:efflux RND transporter permease subunit [Schleiferiaceae bacterium]
MNLSSLSIERPVLATVFGIFIVLFGLIGFNYLGVREFPSVDPPVVTVTTNYQGANAEVIESQITEPLEEAINGIAGIRSLTSVSSDGRSTVTVEFDIAIDMNDAANDVRDKVSRAVRNLPPDADPPIVNKADADADFILSITVQSDRRSLLELTEFGNNVFKERFQTVPGVSEVSIWGEKKYSMKLEIDPRKLAAYGLTPLDVRNALNRENVELPSGRIEGHATELTIRTFGRLTTETEFNDLIIKDEDGALVRLSDVGAARLAPENERTLLRGNKGIPMIGIAVIPQAGSNYIEIVDDIYERVEQIKKDLPEDIILGVALDSTETIRKGIAEVKETIIIAFALVLLVIFFFLRDWRTTIIPVIAIPISLIGSFFIMYLADFSINILTLLGIVLATGLVVDDAIVVMENIYNKIEKGMNPMKAAHKGSKEIIFAVISTTVTLIAVFLPIIFLEGLTGRLFREFGIVVSGAIIISSFVSLTLTPMMSSRILRQKKNMGPFYRKTEDFFQWLIRGYNQSLKKFMLRPWLAIVVMLISGVIMWMVGAALPSELAPLEDKNQLAIQLSAQEGTSFEAMDDYNMQIIALTDTLEEVASLLSVTSPGFGSSVSVNRGFVRLTLKEPSARNRSQQELADWLAPQLRQYNFGRGFVTQQQTIGDRRGGLPVQYVVQATNFDKLKEIIPIFMERAQDDPRFSVVDVDLKFNKPELQVSIDRAKAREMGVSVMDIAETMQLFFSGQRFGFYIQDGKQYQVIGQASRENRDDPLDLRFVSVRNKYGDVVPLDNLITLTDQTSSPQLYRFNRFVSATFSANPAPGLTLGQGIAAMDDIAAEVLDETFSTSLSGASKDFMESNNSLYFAFILALILIYLILAAQFESFRDPLIIMLTVPLAVAGAVLSLWLFDHTFNIFSQIGIIVLVGIVTKNGILIVEFANQKRKDGKGIVNGVIDAATQRFRPILMTSMATILGALPIALALGDSSTSRIPMGVAIIGGLLFSLVLTLYVIPALYTYLTTRKDLSKK